MNKYEAARRFSGGFCAALLPLSRDPLKSEQWLAGWDAGYKFRQQKNEAMNAYLMSVGLEPMAVIRPCDKGGE